jgi:hypothetical protein
LTRRFKFAVAGTHSTGKSTFVAALKERLQAEGLVVADVHDSAADARAEGFPILADHTFDSTGWLIGQAIRLETKASLFASAIIVDRPVPDALGYMLAALRHQDRKLESGRYERLEGLCRAWVGEYDLLFVTELDPRVPIGPGRPDDEQFRIEAARAIAEILRDLRPDAIPLPYGGNEEAIERCVRHVREHRSD